MLDLTLALLSFIFASFSMLVTAAYLKTSINDLDKSAARLSRASETATARLHEDGIPYLTTKRTASINLAVKGYLGVVQDVLTFLLFLRGTEKDVPVRKGSAQVVDGINGLIRTVCVTLAIGVCSLLLLPVVLLITICEAVHFVDHVLRLGGGRGVTKDSTHAIK